MPRIKVIGKQHMEGTSKKTGQPYNFNTVHYNAPARGVDGLAAKTVNIDPAIYPLAQIAIGAEYVVEFDERGYCVGFEPAPKG